MQSAYLVIAHGSRERQSNQAFLKLVEKFRRLHADRFVQDAFLGSVKPQIPGAIETCVRQGATQIFVIPFMLLPGRHVKEDIPRMIQEAREAHPEVDFHYTGPLAEHPLMLRLLEEKAAKGEGRKEKARGEGRERKGKKRRGKSK